MKEQYKKILKSIDFFIIIAVLCIPPIIAPAPANHSELFRPMTSVTTWFYIFAQIILLSIITQYKKKKTHPFLVRITMGDILKVLIFLATLLCSGMLIKTIAQLVCHAQFPSMHISYPPISLVILIPAIILFATREEVLYRFYLINAGSYVGLSVKGAAVFSILLFAMAHFPAGIIAVVNAFVCGTILTVCRIKTQSIWIPIISHSLYNIIIFLIV